jgi:hypothetical protein
LIDCTLAYSTAKPNMSLKTRQNIQASPSNSKRLLSAISRLHSNKNASHFETLLSTTLPNHFYTAHPTHMTHIKISNGRLA